MGANAPWLQWQKGQPGPAPQPLRSCGFWERCLRWRMLGGMRRPAKTALSVLLALELGALGCADEDDGNEKPIGSSGGDIEPPPGGGGDGAGETDSTGKTSGTGGTGTEGSGSGSTSSTTATTTATGSGATSDTGATTTVTVTGICGVLAIPLECCECLILGGVCEVENEACRADPDCGCALSCWYDGVGGFDDCAESCGATDNPLVVDLRSCIQINCPVCLP